MKLANKSFKDRTKITRPQEDWIITENAHEPLVSQQDFDTVQERMETKQRPVTTNNMNIFRGLVFCNDCNRRLSFCAAGNDGKYRCTASVRYGQDECSSHQVMLSNLTAIILKDVQRHASLAAANSKKYAEHLLRISESEVNGKKANLQKESDKIKRRLDEIDTLILKLYEDMTFGIITQERFVSMSAKLETEQSELKKRHTELTEYFNNRGEKSRNVDSFAELIQQYTNITELDSELVHMLIEKIVVHETEIIDGEKCKRIDIYYRFIGNVNESVIVRNRERLAEVS
jgi:hypothetical protein